MATLPNCFSVPLKMQVTEDILTVNLHAKCCILLIHDCISTNPKQSTLEKKKCFDKEISFYKETIFFQYLLTVFL